MIWVGEKGRDVSSTWHITNEEKKKPETYYTEFQAYFEPKSNKVFTRYKLQCRTQNENETCEEFVTALKILVKDCAYANPVEMISDRVMLGLRSSKIREKLITTESDLTLTEARDIAKLYETSRIQLKTMNEKPEGSSAGNKSELNHIEAKHPHRGRHYEFETCRNRGRRKHIQLQEKCSAIDEV